VREARRARALVATARELPTLRQAGVQIDALLQSSTDESERYRPGDLDPPPHVVVTTENRDGGHYVAGDRKGRWQAAPLPGPLADTYGAGDTFAAALTFALGKGGELDEALGLAARAAAAAMTRRGAGIDVVGNSGLKWGEVGD
jgi:ribokinase